MSNQPTQDASFSAWRRLYRAALTLMPHAMRHKHGAAMEALFVHNLTRERARGAMAEWSAGLFSLGDVLRRGVYERAADERAAWRRGGAVHVKRVAAMYAMTLFVLTDVMLALHAYGQWPRWKAEGIGASNAGELLLLAIPFTAALTMPMAVFVAVLLAGRHRTGTTPTLRTMPLLLLFGAVSGGALLWNAEVVPRTNARIVRIQYGETVARENDRSLTLSELRDRSAQLRTELASASRASTTDASTRATVDILSAYQVELHKKLAIAAACVVLAVLALAVLRVAPALSVGGAVGTSVLVFGAYYVGLLAGESAADRQLVSGAAGMWGANGLLVLLAASLWRRAERSTLATSEPETTPTAAA